MTKHIELRLIDAPVPDGETVVKDLAAHLDNEPIGLDGILASAPEPDADGGIDLTDEEFTAFLEAARS